MSKLLFASLILIGIAGHASAAFYFNDFESTVGAEWSNTTVDTTLAGSRKFLGQFGNQDITLTLNGVGAGNTVTLGFDFFCIRSWDGVGNSYAGPDQFKVSVGSATLLDTTFSNVEEEGYRQNWPNSSGGATVAAMTNANEINTLGYTYYGDTVYKFNGGLNPTSTRKSCRR